MPNDLTMPIGGMTCAACATRLERVLSRLEGVESAAVSLASEQADIRFDPARLRPGAVVAAVVKAGFSVPDEMLELAIGGMTCAACATRLERVLGAVEGVVEACVNLAAEQARLRFPAGT